MATDTLRNDSGKEHGPAAYQDYLPPQTSYIQS